MNGLIRKLFSRLLKLNFTHACKLLDCIHQTCMMPTSLARAPLLELACQSTSCSGSSTHSVASQFLHSALGLQEPKHMNNKCKASYEAHTPQLSCRGRTAPAFPLRQTINWQHDFKNLSFAV